MLHLNPHNETNKKYVNEQIKKAILFIKYFCDQFMSVRSHNTGMKLQQSNDKTAVFIAS